MPQKRERPPYEHRPSDDGNLLFAKLPPEVRCNLWHLLLVKPSGSVIPMHVPRDSIIERFVSMETSPDVTLIHDALIHTCRLFYYDQEVHRIYYKFNVFQFRTSVDCLTYIAAITPSRRTAIRNITITMDPIPYKPENVIGEGPNDYLLAVAMMCPNLRVLRHEKFFFNYASTLTDWAIILAAFLKAVVNQLPLLREIYILGGRGDSVQVQCHMTRQNITMSWRKLLANTWLDQPGPFCQSGEAKLKKVWEILCDQKRGISLSLSKERLESAKADTPIKNFHETNQDQSGIPSEIAPTAPARLSKWINDLIQYGMIKDIRFLKSKNFPDICFLPSRRWIPWNIIFCSDRISESRACEFIYRIFNIIERGYQHEFFFGHKCVTGAEARNIPLNKLVGHLWQLKWKDRDKKLEMLRELHRLKTVLQRV